MQTSAVSSGAQCAASAPRPSLEKIAVAARRMGVSVPWFYAVAKRDGLTIVKLGARASAVPSEQIDSWINSRIGNAKGCSK